MPTVTYFMDESSEPLCFEVEDGGTILAAGERLGHDLPCGCHQGHCGACAVEVLEGAKNLSERGPGEEEGLEIVDAKPNCRLACMAEVHGPVKVKVFTD